MNKIKLCFQCSVIVLSFLIWGDAATANDLSGFWGNDSWGEMVVTQNGQDIIAVYTNPSTDVVENYGFKIGDQAFYGTLSGQSLTGKVHLHFPVEFQSVCPEQWAFWDDLELTLSEDSNTLQGRWKNSYLNSAGCTVTDGGWNSVKLALRPIHWLTRAAVPLRGFTRRSRLTKSYQPYCCGATLTATRK